MPLRNLIATVSKSSLSELLDTVCDLAAGRHAFRGVSIALNGHDGVVQGRSEHFRAFSIADWHSLRQRIGPLVAAAPAQRVGERIAVRFAAADAAMMLHADPDPSGAGGATLVAIGHDAPAPEVRESLSQTLSGLLQTITTHVQDYSTSQAALSRLRYMLATMESLAKVGVWQIDQATGRLHGRRDLPLHGLPPGREPDVDTAMAFYPEPARSLLWDHYQRLLETGAGFDLTLPFDRADGERRVVRVVGAGDHEGRRVSSAFGVFQDVTSQARREEELWWAANHDPLDAPSEPPAVLRAPGDGVRGGEPRRLLRRSRSSPTSTASRSSTTCTATRSAIAWLAAVAERLHAAVPVVGRVGGDEFGVVVTGFASREEAQQAARRIIGDLAFDFPTMRLVPITLTAGACVLSSGTCDAAEVLRSADIALIHAKRRGRREVAFYETRFGDEMIRRDRTLTRVRTALARGGVVPYYQPQVDVTSGAVIGVEVLARQVIDGEVTAAADFAIAFADGELAVSIGRVILNAACRDLGALRRRGILPRGCRSTSRRWRSATGLHAQPAAQLEAHGIPASDVLVEITEDVLLGRDQDEVHEALDELAHAGIRVAFDDSHRLRLAHPPRLLSGHQVKIDKRFIADIVTDPVQPGGGARRR